ncbi:MAG: outer membrane beta-barrel protein [Epsilonproteobacteria bacterium]|nr:outer membrane beta-barrel protein [Campylobacterota bacterium]
MIKVNKSFTALFLFTLATSLFAVKFEITPTIAKAVVKADKDSLEDTEVLYGVRASAYLNDQVAIQASLESSQDNTMSDTGKTDIERYALNVMYDMNNGKRVHPYTIVGVGAEKTHRVATPATNDDSQGFINAGAGLKFDISDRINLMTEAKWQRKLENDDDDIIATVGVGVKLGSTAKKAAPIPSVTETSDIDNAINLAEFRKLYSDANGTKEENNSSKVAVVTPVEVVQESQEVAIAETIPFVEEEILEPAVTQSGYYVQMAALFKGNGEVLTNRLEQKDYPYVLHATNRGGKDATLVLVGPYESRVEANVARGYLKRLKSDAFIYHMN